MMGVSHNVFELIRKYPELLIPVKRDEEKRTEEQESSQNLGSSEKGEKYVTIIIVTQPLLFPQGREGEHRIFR